MLDHCLLARELAGALRELTQHVTALTGALAASRVAFAGIDPATLEINHREQAALAEAVQECERRVASQRAALCAALAEPPTSRMSKLLPKLLPATGRDLAEAAAELRRALQALRVEGTVGQRLLDATRRAHDGLLRAIGRKDGPTQRYDRHARSVAVGRSGDIVRGTV